MENHTLFILINSISDILRQARPILDLDFIHIHVRVVTIVKHFDLMNAFMVWRQCAGVRLAPTCDMCTV